MQIIFLNGREVRVSLNEQRALQLLADNDYGMPRSAFYWGSRRYGQYLIDTFYSSKRVNPELHARRELLGIRYSSRANYWGSNTVPNDGKPTPDSTREGRFFKAHPRCSHGIFGTPRRVNLILKKIRNTPQPVLDVSGRCRAKQDIHGAII